MSLSQRKGPVFMAAASICWSFGGLFIKFIPWGAMSIISLRSIFAAVVFMIYRKSVKIDFTRGNVLAALCLSVTTILFVFANKLTTAASAIFLQFTAPIFIVIIEFLFYRKKPKPSEIAAVAATILGMLLFFGGQLDSGAMLGNILAIGSGLAFAGVFVCNKRPDTQPTHSLLLGFFINAVIGLPFCFSQVTADPIAWGSVIFLGVVQVGLAYVFFSIGIKGTTALVACLISALEPVLNPIWVSLFAGETPGVYALAGGAVIIITVVIFNIFTEKNSSKKALPESEAP